MRLSVTPNPKGLDFVVLVLTKHACVHLHYYRPLVASLSLVWADIPSIVKCVVGRMGGCFVWSEKPINTRIHHPIHPLIKALRVCLWRKLRKNLQNVWVWAARLLWMSAKRVQCEKVIYTCFSQTATGINTEPEEYIFSSETRRLLYELLMKSFSFIDHVNWFISEVDQWTGPPSVLRNGKSSVMSDGFNPVSVCRGGVRD